MIDDDFLILYKWYTSCDQNCLDRKTGFKRFLVSKRSIDTSGFDECNCIRFFKLSDGAIIAADTLMCDDARISTAPNFHPSLPNGAPISTSLSTYIWGPLSSSAVAIIVRYITFQRDMRDPFTVRAIIRKDSKKSSDLEMYYHFLRQEDPNKKAVSRLEEYPMLIHCIREGIEITHFKVNHQGIKPVKQEEDLNFIPFGKKNTFFLYRYEHSQLEDPHLQKGDIVDEHYVFKNDEWVFHK